MQNQINDKLNQYTLISSNSIDQNNDQPQHQLQVHQSNYNLVSDPLNTHHNRSYVMQQHFNNYHGGQQHHHNQQQYHTQEIQHDSYFHLQPTNQNLIHKQYYHHYNHHQQHQHTNARLKQIANYAQQQHLKNQQQSNDPMSTTFIFNKESLFGESNQSFRPRVASVSSTSSPDSPSPRFFNRSTSFSSLGNQRSVVIDNTLRCSNLQTNTCTSAATIPNSPPSLSPNQVTYNQQYQQQNNPFTASMNNSTFSNPSTPSQQQQHQQQIPNPIAASQINSCSSSSSVTTTSMSPSDALNLGINLEQYISKRNERERSRVRNVNDAFDNLKNSLPLEIEKMSKRMSKVEILRTAISYIKNLEDVLGYKQQQQQSSEQQQDLASLEGSGLLSNNITIMSQQQQESMNELSSLLQLAVTQSTTPPTSFNSQSTSPPTTTCATSNVCLPFYAKQQQQQQQTMTTGPPPTTTISNIMAHNNVRQQEVYATPTKLTINNDEQHYHHHQEQQQEQVQFAHQDQNPSSYYTNRLPIECLSQEDRSFILEDYQQQQQQQQQDQPVECENNQYLPEQGQQQDEQNDLLDNYNNRQNFD